MGEIDSQDGVTLACTQDISVFIGISGLDF